MKDFFKELYEYNYHFNQKLAEVFANEPDKTSEKALKIFSHILNAQQIWNSRILKQNALYGVWQLQDANDFSDINKVNYQASLNILDNVEFNTITEYSTTKGDVFKNSVRDILFHVINHSTYHRGQVATEFRNHGIDPLVTDYILYKRLM